MTQYSIPLQAVPSQTLTVTLGGQPCRIDVRQAATGLFLSLFVNEQPVATGRLCLNLVRLIRRGFTGDLFFADTQGASDPTWDGLDGRYVLWWDDTL